MCNGLSGAERLHGLFGNGSSENTCTYLAYERLRAFPLHVYYIFRDAWLGSCRYLVQDFERCLRCQEPLIALEEIGVELVENYPRCSQDFNAIENAWDLLTLRGRASRRYMIEVSLTALCMLDTLHRRVI